MVLNEREKVIAWAVGGVVGAAILYFGAQMFYFAPKDKLIKDLGLAATQKADIEKSVKESRIAYNTWNDLDIQDNPSAVEQPARTRIFSLAQQYGFQISGWSNTNPHPIPKQPDFQEVTFTAAAETTTARLGRFLTMLESQHDLPIRLDDLAIQARKPGQDDLHVEMTIKALIYVPKDKKLLALAPPSMDPLRVAAPGTPVARNVAPRQGAVAAVTPAPTFNILNAELGSLDPSIPDGTSMEDRLKSRRQMELDGKPLGKPRFGTPLEVAPGQSPEEAMAKRKAEQLKNAETQAAAAEAAAKKAAEDAAPKLLPNETIDQYMVRRRREQEQASGPASAPAATQGVLK